MFVGCGLTVGLISFATPARPRVADPKLIALLSCALDWFERFATGKADRLEAIAKDEQITGLESARQRNSNHLTIVTISDGRQSRHDIERLT